MKKLIAILLCAVMLLSLAACGQETVVPNDQGYMGGEANADNNNTVPPNPNTPDRAPTAEELAAIEQYRKIILMLQAYDPENPEITPYVFEDFGYQPAEPAKGTRALLHYLSTLQNMEIIDPWMGSEYANEPNMLWDRVTAIENVQWTLDNYRSWLEYNHVSDPGFSTEYTAGGFKRAGTVQSDEDTICLNDYLMVYNYAGQGEEVRWGQIQIDFKRMVEDYQHRLADEVPDLDYIRNYRDPKDAANALAKWMLPAVMKCTTDEYNAEIRMIDFYGKFNNGDVVCFTWEAIEPELKEFKALWDVEFVYEDFTFTFGGLVPLYEIYTEEVVQVTYTGNNGNGTATAIIDMQMEYDQIYAQLEIVSGNNGSLSNGDKIVVKIDENTQIDFRLYANAKLDTTELELVVSGLPE